MKVIGTYNINAENKIDRKIEFIMSAKTPELRRQRLDSICSGCKRYTCNNCSIEGAVVAAEDAERRAAQRRHKIAIA